MKASRVHTRTLARAVASLAWFGRPRGTGEAIKDLLELLGADVVGPAATTADAERLLFEHALDAALVDFHLRGGEVSSGLIARLHEEGVPVIVISGSSESPSLLPVEAATILEKPFTEAQLLASLRPLLHRRSPVRRRLAPRHELLKPSSPM
jgi:DNA-binding response OmpR family regulator